MAVQVGGYCFASPADAAPHACAAFAPVTQISGGTATTVSCSSANPDGTLSMARTLADINGVNPPVTTYYTSQMDYPPCVQQDYLEAAEAVAGPVLACVVVCWGLWKINSYLGWGRADAS